MVAHDRVAHGEEHCRTDYVCTSFARAFIVHQNFQYTYKDAAYLSVRIESLCAENDITRHCGPFERPILAI